MSDSLFRISLKAYIENDKGEVLVVKEHGRDRFDMPGGGLEFGETIKEALARELKEETGYDGEFTYEVIGAENPHLLLRGIWQVRLICKLTPETYEFGLGEESDEVMFANADQFEKSDSGAERLVCYYWRKQHGDTSYSADFPLKETEKGW